MSPFTFNNFYGQVVPSAKLIQIYVFLEGNVLRKKVVPEITILDSKIDREFLQVSPVHHLW